MQSFSAFSLSTRVVLLYGSQSGTVKPRDGGGIRPATVRRAQWEYIRDNKGLRAVVVAQYGGACVRCGAREKLELDHIHNDGKRHRQQLRELQLTIDEWLIMERFPRNVVQLLCKDCHSRKTREARRHAQRQRRRNA